LNERFLGKKKYLLAIAVPAAILVILACVFRYPQRALFSFREWRRAQEWKDHSIWLPDYVVVMEAVPVEGIRKNLSGLTWNGETKTLFAVINNPAEIVELSTDGLMLRRIKLFGFEDPEAVEYIGDNRYIVADEQTQKIICVTIDAETSEIHAAGLQRLTLGMGPVGNKGLEGLAWDFSNRKLYAAKERSPVHSYEVTGFPQEPNTTMDIEVGSNKTRDQQLFVSDVSSLDFNQRHQHLLVLSHESKIVIEVSKSGEPVSSLSLLTGHGLTRPVPQAEGLAMDDQDNLYLVSEPNLFYVFRKKAEE
jgi:uncharacterized protein YjiK